MGTLTESRLVDRPLFSAIEVGKIAALDPPTIAADMELRDLEEIYNNHPDWDYMPVVDGDDIVGYFQRDYFKAKLGQNEYSRTILLREGKPIRDYMKTEVAVLDSRMHLPEASELLMAREDRDRYDPFVITYHGRLYGTGSVKDVMRGINYYQARDLTASQVAQESAMLFSLPESEKFRLGYKLRQLHGVGGDYVYAAQLSKSHFTVLLGDVSGKGLQAANMANFIMGTARTLVEDWRAELSKTKSLLIGDHYIANFNRLVAEGTAPESYAASSYFFVDLERNFLKYYDFGGTTVFLRRDDKIYSLPKADPESALTPFFGMDAGSRPVSKNIGIRPGDLFVAYSDGLNESRNQAKEEFGEDRVRNCLRTGPKDPDAMVSYLYSNLLQFKSTYRWIDDLSIVCFQISD